MPLVRGIAHAFLLFYELRVALLTNSIRTEAARDG